MTGLTCAEPKPSGLTAGYMPVQVDMLRRLRQTPVDLFVQYETNAEPVLYHRGGCSLEAAQVARLTDAGVRQIYVLNTEFHKFSAHLLHTIDSGAEHEAV